MSQLERDLAFAGLGVVGVVGRICVAVFGTAPTSGFVGGLMCGAYAMVIVLVVVTRLVDRKAI